MSDLAMPTTFEGVRTSPNLTLSLNRALEHARDLRQREVSIEHLLLALTDDPDATGSLEACGVDLARLKTDIATSVDRSAGGQGDGPAPEPVPSPDLRNLLNQSVEAAREAKRQDINSFIVLAAIVGQEKSEAATILQAHGFTFVEAIEALKPRLARADEHGALKSAAPSSGRAPAGGTLPSSPAPTTPPSAANMEEALAQSADSLPPLPVPRPTRSLTNPNRRPPQAQPALASDRPAPSPPVARAPQMPQPSAAPPAAQPPASAPSAPPTAKTPRGQPQSVDDIMASVRDKMGPARGPAPSAPRNPGAPPSSAPSPAPAPAERAEPSVPRPAAIPRLPMPPQANPAPQPSAPPTGPVPSPPSPVAQGHPASRQPGQQPPAAPQPAPAQPGPSLSAPSSPPPVPGRRHTDGTLVGAPPGAHRPSPEIYDLGAPTADERISPPGRPPRGADTDGGPAAGGGVPRRREPSLGAPPPVSGGAAPGGPAPLTNLASRAPRARDSMPAPVPIPAPPSLPTSPLQSQPHAPPPQMGQSHAPAPGRRPGLDAVNPGQLAEAIPRHMRLWVPEKVEVRIARRSLEGLAAGIEGRGQAARHDIVITSAMSVRLKAPDGGFAIDSLSPDTQWIENRPGLVSNDEFASWRWTVRPMHKGRARLHLIVSARTAGADGSTAETALPDQIIEIKVRTNWGLTAKRWAGWITAAVIGGALGKFGEGTYELLRKLAGL